MIDSSISLILTPLQQSAAGLISLVLGITQLLHFILIISFLGVVWNRNNSQQDAIKAGKVVLGIYTVLLMIDALIYSIGVLQGSLPYNPMIASNPVFFFVLFSPPVPLMYLDLRLPESSRVYTSLSNSALVLLVWLVVIFIAIGAIGSTVVYY